MFEHSHLATLIGETHIRLSVRLCPASPTKLQCLHGCNVAYNLQHRCEHHIGYFAFM